MIKHKPYKFGIHWMRHDLRTSDNEGLYRLQSMCEKIAVVYVFDPNWLENTHFGHCHLGRHRHVFLDQGLCALTDTLASLNIRFYMLSGDPVHTLNALINSNKIDCMSYESHYGYQEQQQIISLKKSLVHCHFIQGNSHYLLEHARLPFSIDDMPDVFSPFRRQVEKKLFVRSAQPLHSLTSFTQAADLPAMSAFQTYTPTNSVSHNGYQGSETGAFKRIAKYFFETDGISTYKETRNGLDGWDFSSRLSAYLSLGFVSPAYIYQQINEYEAQRVKNDSTYWLFFELLWREFFHLQAKKQGALFFSKGGIRQQPPCAEHNVSRFEQWTGGRTPYPIVNAAMNQLARTGFLSNRSRQLVASCFVHELALDWRYGAAYFEEMLIDFDVASNYGNWQYLAGVGSDPRGHRQFNLQKQTDIYDPEGTFIRAWR